MQREELRGVLSQVERGQLSVEEAVSKLGAFPTALDLGHSTIDTAREARCGCPEVVYGAGKTPQELLEISRSVLEHHKRLLVTRATDEGAALLEAELEDVVIHERSRAITVGTPEEPDLQGLVAVVSAGTSDGAVAEEAAVTAQFMGARVAQVRDAGVAGLHRLLAHGETLQRARALVVVAGMEGALPSVVGGLVARPVIAVPTSVWYGASFGGIALLAWSTFSELLSHSENGAASFSASYGLFTAVSKIGLGFSALLTASWIDQYAQGLAPSSLSLMTIMVAILCILTALAAWDGWRQIFQVSNSRTPAV